MPFERKVLLPGGGYSEPRKIGEGETDKERAERLEMETAYLAYQNMLLAADKEELMDQVGTLTYTLMIKGVI